MQPIYAEYLDPRAASPAPTSRWVFPTIGDWADACEALPRIRGAKDASQENPSAAWYGRMSLERAIQMGREGGYWPEALKDMRPLALDEARLLEGGELEVPTLRAEVAGFAPIVPHHLIGVPDAMLAMPPDTIPNRVLRIGVGIIGLSNISRETVFNRGNAVLSIVDALETHCNFSCEIVAVWAAQTRGMPNIRTVTEITIKRADQRWDPASVAFALCHAAFGRRLGFKWVESHDQTAPLTQSHYGTHYSMMQANSAVPAAEKFDVIFENLRSEQGFSSREQAIKTLLADTVAAIKARGAGQHNDRVRAA